MGRKRARKRERRAAQRPGRTWEPASDFEAEVALFDEDFVDMFPMLGREQAVISRTCGGCKEFIEDGEGGRGTCLHPASGVLSPWTDTEACSYWRRR